MGFSGIAPAAPQPPKKVAILPPVKPNQNDDNDEDDDDDYDVDSHISAVPQLPRATKPSIITTETESNRLEFDSTQDTPTHLHSDVLVHSAAAPGLRIGVGDGTNDANAQSFVGIPVVGAYPLICCELNLICFGCSSLCTHCWVQRRVCPVFECCFVVRSVVRPVVSKTNTTAFRDSIVHVVG